MVLWFLAEFHWLYWAYQVEMQGRSRFLALHAAAGLFFLAHCLAMALAVTHHRQPQRLQGPQQRSRSADSAAKAVVRSGGPPNAVASARRE